MSLMPLSLLGSLVAADVPTHRVGWHWLREIIALEQNTVHRFQRFYLDLVFDSVGNYFNVESVCHRDDHSHNTFSLCSPTSFCTKNNRSATPSFTKIVLLCLGTIGLIDTKAGFRKSIKPLARPVERAINVSDKR